MTLAPPRTSGDAVAYFDRLAPEYAKYSAIGLNFQRRLALFRSGLLDAYDTVPGNLCLDLGCGNGVLARLACDLGFRTVGFDGSAEMLRLARTVHTGTAIDFRMEQLPLTDATVEDFRGAAAVVIASSVIEYLDDDERFLRQCAAMLAPGGRALVSFPNAQSLWRRYERLLGARGHLRDSIVSVQRRQYWGHDVPRLARRAGLDLAGITYFGVPRADRVARFIGGAPPWWATLFLADLRRSH